MAVGAHAEHGRRRRAAGLRQRRLSISGTNFAAAALSDQQRLAHQLRIGPLARLGHLALVDQRHRHAMPWQIDLRQLVEEQSWVSCRRKRPGSPCPWPRWRASALRPRHGPGSRPAPRARRKMRSASIIGLDPHTRCARRARSAPRRRKAPRCRRYRAWAGQADAAQASRIGSIQAHAASTSSRRMNSVWLPRTTSISSRS